MHLPAYMHTLLCNDMLLFCCAHHSRSMPPPQIPFPSGRLPDCHGIQDACHADAALGASSQTTTTQMLGWNPTARHNKPACYRERSKERLGRAAFAEPAPRCWPTRMLAAMQTPRGTLGAGPGPRRSRLPGQAGAVRAPLGFGGVGWCCTLGGSNAPPTKGKLQYQVGVANNLFAFQMCIQNAFIALNYLERWRI